MLIIYYLRLKQHLKYTRIILIIDFLFVYENSTSMNYVLRLYKVQVYAIYQELSFVFMPGFPSFLSIYSQTIYFQTDPRNIDREVNAEHVWDGMRGGCRGMGIGRSDPLFLISLLLVPFTFSWLPAPFQMYGALGSKMKFYH